MQIAHKATILIVEDKFIVAEDIAKTLQKLGYEVQEPLMSGEEALELCKTFRPDIVLMDIQLKGTLDGVETAKKLRELYDLPVIYLTAHSDDATLHRASSTEPLGYLLKPFEERQLYTTVELALNTRRAEKQSKVQIAAASTNASATSIRALPEFSCIIGEHPLLLELLNRTSLVAKTDVTVYIFGENGTGKELIADAVHRLSARKAKPFVKLNCSAIPTTLLESALFGHAKGSFTGASKDQIGFVEHAEGGTLFLDEIGDISAEIQVKLLRLLQLREYTRIGEVQIRKADIRIITATNQNLKNLVKAGKIREDFFYRIHVFPLEVPPLRERGPDVVLLAEHFRSLFNQTFGKHVAGFTSEATNILSRHLWPGNIRELENAIRHAFVVVPEAGTIDSTHLPPDVLRAVTDASIPARRNDETTSAAPSVDERQAILEALAKTGGSKSQAAKLLGYSRVTLWKKMSRLGLDTGGEDSREPTEQ